jgi:predicted metal-dependent HD superfamily phosphohydrolase
MILQEAEIYMISVFREKFSPEICFHDLLHTKTVIHAVKEIGSQSSLSEDQMEIAILAGWFHDAGYGWKYIGHEEESNKVCAQFLKKVNYSPYRIAQVLSCIDATRIPQHPLNLTEEVLCDADFYHLSQPGYPQNERLLRQEWLQCLDRKYTDTEWNNMNYTFLKTHQYFTDYGKKILQKGKEKNMNELELRSIL